MLPYGIAKIDVATVTDDSVQFKRDTLKMWDGEDYPAWVEQWCENNPDVNKDLLDLTKERWPSIVDQFGGQQS